MHCSLSGSSVHGIFQARVLEWVGVSFSRLLCPWDFPGKSTGVGCCFLPQGIFPTQGSNPGLLHCRQTLYHLSHQGSPTTFIDPAKSYFSIFYSWTSCTFMSITNFFCQTSPSSKLEAWRHRETYPLSQTIAHLIRPRLWSLALFHLHLLFLITSF